MSISRPPLWRLLLGLLVAAPLPALVIKIFGVTHEIWLASAVTMTMFYALFALTGIVRMTVPDARRLSNMLRASRVGGFMAIATTLGFVALFMLGVPEMAVIVWAVLGAVGMISGALFWLCVYA